MSLALRLTPCASTTLQGSRIMNLPCRCSHNATNHLTYLRRKSLNAYRPGLFGSCRCTLRSSDQSLHARSRSIESSEFVDLRLVHKRHGAVQFHHSDPFAL